MTLFVLTWGEAVLSVQENGEAASREAQRWQALSGSVPNVVPMQLGEPIGPELIDALNDDDEAAQSQPVDDPTPGVTADTLEPSPVPLELDSREQRIADAGLLYDVLTASPDDVPELTRKMIRNASAGLAGRVADLIVLARNDALTDPSPADIQLLGALASTGWHSIALEQRFQDFREHVLTPALN